MPRGRISTVAGILLGALGLAFVVASLWADWSQVLAVIRSARPLWLGAGFALGLVAMGLIGLGWWRALRLVGCPRTAREALRWYFVGQLGKYVPGGVWAVVGSAELAVGGGATRARSYGAMVLSLGATYLAGIMAVGVLLPLHPHLMLGIPWTGVLVGIVPLGILAAHPVVVRKVAAIAARVLKRELDLEVPTWGTSLQLTLMHLPAWGAVGLANWCVANGLGIEASLTGITLASILAWVTGFLAVLAPGGLGVREAVFVLAAAPLSSGLAAAVAVLSRVLFMLVDVLAASLMSLFPSRRGGGAEEPLGHQGPVQPDPGGDPDGRR